MKIYYGTDLAGAQQYVSSKKQFRGTSGGEFGIGQYFWHENLPAAILTALQYDGTDASGWAVVEIEFDDFNASLQAIVGTNRQEPKGVLELCPNYELPIVRTRAKQRVNAGGGVHVVLNNALHPAQAFRQINASPAQYNIQAADNSIAWKYHLIIGQTAAVDYGDSSLIQFKFANAGLDLLNGNAGTRRIAMQGAK